jgi:hypothetical protein
MQVEIVFVIVHAILACLLMMVDEPSLRAVLYRRQEENLRLMHKEARAPVLFGELVEMTRNAADRHPPSTSLPQAGLRRFLSQVSQKSLFFLIFAS